MKVLTKELLKLLNPNPNPGFIRNPGTEAMNRLGQQPIHPETLRVLYGPHSARRMRRVQQEMGKLAKTSHTTS